MIRRFFSIIIIAAVVLTVFTGLIQSTIRMKSEAYCPGDSSPTARLTIENPDEGDYIWAGIEWGDQTCNAWVGCNNFDVETPCYDK